MLAACPRPVSVHGGQRPVDGQLSAEFAAFCAEHQDELDGLLLTKSTQTNEIHRCAAVRLGLGHSTGSGPAR